MENKFIFTYQDYINELIKLFPEIKDEVLDEDYNGLITLQTGVFRKFTQEAIDSHNVDMVKKCFHFVDSIFESSEFKVQNALLVAYLEHINTKKPIVNKILSTKLRNLIDELADYNNTSLKDNDLNNFLENLSK